MEQKHILFSLIFYVRPLVRKILAQSLYKTGKSFTLCRHLNFRAFGILFNIFHFLSIAKALEINKMATEKMQDFERLVLFF